MRDNWDKARSMTSLETPTVGQENAVARQSKCVLGKIRAQSDANYCRSDSGTDDRALQIVNVS
jgi:hypothetical protein